MLKEDLKQKFTVYKITNLLNGKIYIGKHQCTDLNDSYMGSGKLIRAAQKKYGIENFSKEILFVFETEEEMNAKEAELVNEEFVDRDDTYNICFGGQGGFGYINRTRDHLAHNRKIAEKRNYKDPIFIQKMREAAKSTISSKHKEGKMVNAYFNNRPDYEDIKNKSKTPEAIAKKRKTMAENGHAKGSKNSQYGSIWITNGVENKKIKAIDKIPEGFYKGRKIRPYSITAITSAS